MNEHTIKLSRLIHHFRCLRQAMGEGRSGSIAHDPYASRINWEEIRKWYAAEGRKGRDSAGAEAPEGSTA